MTRNKKIIISILVGLVIVFSSIFIKLKFSSISIPYLKTKISTLMLDLNGTIIDVDQVKLRLMKDIGFAIEIPNIKINSFNNININNTIADIDIFSILFKGFLDSDINISSRLDLYSEQSFDLKIVSRDSNFIIKELVSDNFFISEDIIIEKDNYYPIDIDLIFTKKFIEQNFKKYLKIVNEDYAFDLSNFFFDENIFYKSKLKINLDYKELYIERFDNKHNIKLETKINYFDGEYKINLKSVIPNVNLTKIFNTISKKRETNNDKILKTLSDSLYKEQNIEVKLVANDELKPKEIEIIASGQLSFNYRFDENEDFSYLKGIAPYKINLYKKSLLDDFYKISSNIDLINVHSYIRQINLVKSKNEKLVLTVNSTFDLKKDIELRLETKNTDNLSLNGNIALSKDNHLIFNNLYVSNKDNADFSINGSLKNRNLIAKITGDVIDLSKNIIKINDKVKGNYYQSEVYNIFSRIAYLNSGVLADDFSVKINKKKNMIKVESKGNILKTSFDYIREKDNEADVSVIKSANIINTVGANHSARKLIKNGEATLTSYRSIGSTQTSIEIDLANFTLINTPASLKLLSLPSFSGLSSVLNNESGIEFAYGKLAYKVNEDAYSDINAFAVNDGIGLIVNGNIDRKNKKLNLDGQISPLHLISGIIQKIPFFGKLLIGNEGEGILAVEYTMVGSQDNPEVSSNPLTIFKPRLFQRTIDFLNNNNIN
ncbi:AsmA-like C-terminal domain-containing protein [Pelagibacterales bacterium]|nr:AsmA-like C-terminal domain-containing protein [Pelagibacterales bacterium]